MTTQEPNKAEQCQHVWQRIREPNPSTGGFTVTDRCKTCGIEASREVPPVDPAQALSDTINPPPHPAEQPQAEVIPPKPQTAELPAVQTQKIIMQDDSEFAFYLDTGKFEHMYRVGNALSKSTIVPEHYQGNPANCVLALNMALRLSIDPFMFMQKTTVINGKLGFEAQLIIAIVNSQKPFQTKIKFKYEGTAADGDTFACTAYATDKDGEKLEYTLTVGQAKKIGNAKKNENWNNTPELMLAYRSATYLIRINAPEILMGMSTIDELIDITPASSGVVNANPAQILAGAVATDMVKQATTGSAMASKPTQYTEENPPFSQGEANVK